MTYRQALEYITSLSPRGWRLGLDRMEELVRRAGLHDAIGRDAAPQYIHVAGTNGKGSVTAFLQYMLSACGYRSGGFFSPYVYDVRERIQADAEMISERDFADITAHLQPIAESLTGSEFDAVTEFEFKTAMGFLYWKRRRCDWVALEVGLGGRLDSTNVVTPRCSVIVSIGLDHTQILGETLAKIAREKAGIIKPHVPVVAGHLPKDAMQVVEGVAGELDAPLWRFGKEFALESRDGSHHVTTPVGRFEALPCPLIGKHMPHNLAVAVAAMAASGAATSAEAVREGARATRIPGRFERAEFGGVPFILDGAHNAESAQALHDTLRSLSARKFVLLTGMVGGHDPESFFRPLLPIVERAEVAPIDFHRAIPPMDLAVRLRKLGVHARPHTSLEAAIASASEGEHPVLVTGSFYLVGDVGRRIGIGDKARR